MHFDLRLSSFVDTLYIFNFDFIVDTQFLLIQWKSEFLSFRLDRRCSCALFFFLFSFVSLRSLFKKHFRSALFLFKIP